MSTDGNDLQTDAVPHMPREENVQEGNISLDSNVNGQIGNGSTGSNADLNDQYEFSEQLHDSSHKKTENDSISHTSSASEEKTDSDSNDIPKSRVPPEPPFSMNRTSVIVNGGVGIQLGNNITNNNAVNYIWNGVNKSKQFQPDANWTFEKSVEIRELLKNEMELEAKHLDILSCYLGKKWKEIGKFLGFTSGELDAAGERGGTYKEKAFEMLNRWCQKTGDEATVGTISSKMWESKIPAAMEAVQQLSVNIKHMV